MSRLALMGAGPSGAAIIPFADTRITSGNGGLQSLVAAVTTYDFTNPLSTADVDARRKITLLMISQGGTANTHTSVTLYPTATDRTNGTNGVALTKRGVGMGTAADTASTHFISVWDGALPTGTTWYVRLVISAASTRAFLHGWTHSRTWFDTQAAGSGAATTLSVNITVPLGGKIITAGGVTSASGVQCTPTGYTEEFDALASGTLYVEGGSIDIPSGASNFAIGNSWFLSSDGVTPAGSNNRLLAVSYGAAV